MKCDKCGSPKVVTKIVIQNDKGSDELNLCIDCFQKFVKDHPGMTKGPGGNSVNEFIQGALNYLNSGLKALNADSTAPAADTRICPGCSTPVMMIQKNRKTGCPECYRTFEKEISGIIYSLTGKRYSHDAAPQAAHGIAELEDRLLQAVKSENYEYAAILKTELDRMKRNRR